MTTTLPPNLRRRGTPPAQPSLIDPPEDPAPVEAPRQTDPAPDRPAARNGHAHRTDSRREAQLADVLTGLIDLDALREKIGAATTTDAAARADLDALRARVDDLEKRAPTHRIEIIDRTGDEETTRTKNGRAELALLVKLATAYRPENRNFAMSGPAGTGKSTLAADLAETLGRPFLLIPVDATMTSAALFGRPTVDGRWTAAGFVDAYAAGSVILLDEADSGSPDLVMKLNSTADSRAIVSRPDHPDPAQRAVKRHPDTVLLLACNTWGHGPDAQYVGRAPQDAATCNRFRWVHIGYDPAIDRAVCPDNPLRARLDEIRAAIEAHKLRQVLSPRDYGRAYDEHRAGFAWPEIVRGLVARWSEQERAKLPTSAREALR